jgi:NADH:ubiquinone oxidoreductase subunit 6 (subunit J)
MIEGQHMADPAFIATAILTIGAAIVALESRELIYGGIALAISMLGVAGFFLLLDSPFVAMFQITVYVGAVAVLVIFTVMLVRTQELFSKREDRGRKRAGIVLLLVFMVGLGAIFVFSGLNNPNLMKIQGPGINFTDIGKQMLTYYSPAFVVLGLVLAAAVIGALTLARREDIEQQHERSD